MANLTNNFRFIFNFSTKKTEKTDNKTKFSKFLAVFVVGYIVRVYCTSVLNYSTLEFRDFSKRAPFF